MACIITEVYVRELCGAAPFSAENYEASDSGHDLNFGPCAHAKSTDHGHGKGMPAIATSLLVSFDSITISLVHPAAYTTCIKYYQTNPNRNVDHAGDRPRGSTTALPVGKDLIPDGLRLLQHILHHIWIKRTGQTAPTDIDGLGLLQQALSVPSWASGLTRTTRLKSVLDVVDLHILSTSCMKRKQV